MSFSNCAWFLLLVGLTHPSASRSDDALKNRVREEYPVALAKLEARYSSMHGQAELTEFKFQPDPATRETAKVLDFAFAPGHAKLSFTTIKAWDKIKPNETMIYQNVFALNADYWFVLSRHNPDEALALKDVSEDKSKGRSRIHNQHENDVRCAYSVHNTAVSAFFNRNMFQIDDVFEENVVGETKRLVVLFTLIHSPDKPRAKNASFVDGGWLTICPEEGWIVREYGVVHSTSDKSVTYFGKVEYARSPDGHLDPVRHTQRTYPDRASRDNPGKPIVGFDLDFKTVKYEALPDSEFRLPAFGMPDLGKGKEGASTARPYGLFALATVGFGIAGGLKYLSSKMKRS